MQEQQAAERYRGDRELALIGPGRLGLHLALRMVSLGWRCTAVRGRRTAAEGLRRLLPASVVWDTWSRPETWTMPAILFLCVPDRHIEAVAGSVAESFDLRTTVVLHCSGLVSSDALAACARCGGETASWHPLQSFPPVAHGAAEWNGVFCAIEGSDWAVATGSALARELGMVPWRIDAAAKPRYHAAAAVAGNLTHILVVLAKRLLASCGTPAESTGYLLRPLVLRSLTAALDAHDLEALTGPIARDDQATIEHHLQVLPERLAAVYSTLQGLIQGSDDGSDRED